MKKLNIITILLLLSTFSLWSMEDGMLGKRKHPESEETQLNGNEIVENGALEQADIYEKRLKKEEICHWNGLPVEIHEYILFFVSNVKDLRKALDLGNLDKIATAFKQYILLRSVCKNFRNILPTNIINEPMQKKLVIKRIFLKAAKSGNISVLKMLCDNDFASRYADIEDWFISAIGYGQVPFCRYLIEKGLFKNIENAPLIFAIILQDKDAVEGLIKEGNKEGMLFGKYTENMVAAACGNLEIFKLFHPYTRGAPIFKKTACSSLKCAARNGHIKIVMLLFKSPIDYTHCSYDYNEYWDRMDALAAAASNDQIGIVAYLLSFGRVHINDTTLCGSESALGNACKNGNREMVEFLLDQAAKPNLKIENSAWDSNRITALVFACKFGDIEIIKLLLNEGARVDQSSYWPVLMISINKGNLDIAKLLVEHGADINAQTEEERITPLIEAASCGHIDIVKWLISKNAEINAVNKHGETALDSAYKKGHVEIAKYLEANGGIKKEQIVEGPASIKDEEDEVLNFINLDHLEDLCTDH